MRDEPGRILIRWAFASFVPTNRALKAASVAGPPTNGWIGAMEGRVEGEP
jgi:hypothetical protein